MTVAIVISDVCLRVRDLKEKSLSCQHQTWNTYLHIMNMTQRSKSQRSTLTCEGRTDGHNTIAMARGSLRPPCDGRPTFHHADSPARQPRGSG